MSTKNNRQNNIYRIKCNVRYMKISSKFENKYLIFYFLFFVLSQGVQVSFRASQLIHVRNRNSNNKSFSTTMILSFELNTFGSSECLGSNVFSLCQYIIGKY